MRETLNACDAYQTVFVKFRLCLQTEVVAWSSDIERRVVVCGVRLHTILVSTDRYANNIVKVDSHVFDGIDVPSHLDGR